MRRLLTPLLLGWALCACTNGKAHDPCDKLICPIGQECRSDGTCRAVPSRKLDAAVSGEPDAQLATNEIMLDAGAALDAAVPSVDASPPAPPRYQMHGASIGLSDSPAPGLHMIDQRIDGLPSACAAVSGKRLCLQGGIRP